MRLRAATSGLALLAACGDVPTLQPRVISPAAQSDAYPFAAIDELVLSVARAGEMGDIALVTGGPGGELSLGDIDFAANLVVHLSGLAEGVELAYGRSCAIDVRRGDVPEPALYFSRVARWADVEGEDGDPGEMEGYTDPRGRAVFVDPAAGAVSIYDPSAGGFQGFTGTIPSRPGAVLAPIEGGRSAVLVGGDSPEAGAVWLAPADAEAESELRRGDQVASSPGIGVLVDHDAVTLTDGSVLSSGGRTGDIVRRRAHLIAVGPSGPEPPELLPATMIASRAGHTMTGLSDAIGADVILIGGVNGAGAAVAECEIYRPLRRRFEALPTTVLNMPRWGHRSVRLPSGFVLVVGGYTALAGEEPVPVRELELYDPVLSTFSVVGTLPSAAGITGHSLTELPDGRVLLSGGLDIDGNATSASFIVRFDPIDGGVDVVATDSLSSARAGAAVVPLCDGTVMAVGGSAGVERYNPSSAARR